MNDRARILVVEDDDAMRLLLEEQLHEAGYEALTARNGTEALERLATTAVDVVVSDVVMPGMRGTELLGELRRSCPSLPLVLITAFGNIDAAVEAVKAGAYHYITKPFRMEKLLHTVAAAVQEKRLDDTLVQLGVEAPTKHGHTIVAGSMAMQRALALLRRAAAADTPVLLLGESGTGKEMLARALHADSQRAARSFLAVNCQAIPDSLLESQLFGYLRGSFTDAREDRRGLFQEAHRGTLLLDEIGDMPPGLQGKLLRVLQEREVHPIGAPAPVPVDVRVIAATHRDLPTMVEEGRFRQDLFFRLNVITVRIPPLRERPEDLLPLVAHFLQKHCQRLGRPHCTMSVEAVEILRRYSWPGNVRELENVIERALVLGAERRIGREDLPEDLQRREAPREAEALRALSEVERDQILKTLRAVGGNKTAAARILGLDRKTLYRKLELYGIR